MTSPISERWLIYANNHRTKTKKGLTVTLSAHQYFLKLNLVRVFNDLEPALYPPDE